MIHFICPMVRGDTDRQILWQRDHYCYQLGDGPYLFGSLEEVQKELAKRGWTPVKEN